MIAMQTPTPSNAEKTPEDRSEQFVAVEGGQDTASAEGLMVAAYSGMWAILMLFVFLSWRRQQKLNARVGELEDALARRARAGSDHAA